MSLPRSVKYTAVRSGPCDWCGRAATAVRTFVLPVRIEHLPVYGSEERMIRVLQEAVTTEADTWRPELRCGRC